MPTSLLSDCARFAQLVTAAGSQLPDALANLLASHELLASPAATQRPEDAIMDAALDGTLDQKTLDKLLPIAATRAQHIEYRKALAKNCAHVLVGQWHRELAAGGADAILDSMRDSFDRHAAAIAAARDLFGPESSPEQILASGEPKVVTAWQELPAHLNVIGRIASVAREFGCQQLTALFPL